ncbi:uncharacterized protein PGTG_05182 [Puccinia graminis f. sp. tritici CRL 75-36-700-3]|uniref:Uncharacterized protein n=1 Tax=Puccinia graminis f. sp. tritici (strain CRL 75-36-700-3 / race SCCL) TaxID=418459 RepID=E3K6Z8_PUCGT|nr:uncharacterized protein PGTG_05182 [Puccinia graminis f. sp. tritici CRL 75-36-700-3]EFP79957.2 hypothetical protein PGTG_05182 [Puccinia graminis f. sp. tritici CRL 75-36-700-3]
MPALTAYAHPPAHAGWTSLSSKPSTLSHTSSSCSGSALAPAASPITQIPGRPRSNISRFERLTKPLSSSASRLKKTKSANNCQLPQQQQQQQQQPDIILATPRPQPAVRGILTKHSSLLNLSPRAQAVVESSPVAVVLEPTIVEPLCLLPSRAQMVTKKVRFSGNPQDGYGRSMSSRGCGGCKALNQGHSQGCMEEEGCRRAPEPVIETIFLTYSRFAYDRSPIAVDRVFNKSLALPPRTDNDDDLGNGRWRADLLPPSLTDSPISLEDSNRLKLPFPADLAADLEPTLLPRLSLSPVLQGPADPPPIFVAAHEGPESAASWQISSDLFGPTSHSEDGSTSSSSSQESPTTPAITELMSKPPTILYSDLSHLIRQPPLATAPTPSSTTPFSLSVQNLAHHALANLNLNEHSLPPPARLDHRVLTCLPLDNIQPSSGFGNWNRAQVFGSCDALDGF